MNGDAPDDGKYDSRAQIDSDPPNISSQSAVAASDEEPGIAAERSVAESNGTFSRVRAKEHQWRAFL